MRHQELSNRLSRLESRAAKAINDTERLAAAHAWKMGQGPPPEGSTVFQTPKGSYCDLGAGDEPRKIVHPKGYTEADRLGPEFLIVQLAGENTRIFFRDRYRRRESPNPEPE
jgi:hypothetical protein